MRHVPRIWKPSGTVRWLAIADCRSGRLTSTSSGIRDGDADKRPTERTPTSPRRWDWLWCADCKATAMKERSRPRTTPNSLPVLSIMPYIAVRNGTVIASTWSSCPNATSGKPTSPPSKPWCRKGMSKRLCVPTSALMENLAAPRPVISTRFCVMNGASRVSLPATAVRYATSGHRDVTGSPPHRQNHRPKPSSPERMWNAVVITVHCPKP